MDIRELKREDAADWLAVRVRMLTDHPRDFGSDASDYASTSVADIEKRIEKNSRPDSRMYGAFAEDRLVGTIGYFEHAGRKRVHVREMWGMYVDPSARRKGVGQKLVERALEDLRVLPGVTRVILGVSVGNEGARALYESCGFEVYGKEPDGLKIGDHFEDTVLMSRRM